MPFKAGSLAIFGSAVSVALFGVFAELLSGVFSDAVQVAVRSAVAAMIALIAAWPVRKDIATIDRQDLGRILVVGVGTLVSIFCLTEAVQRTSVREAAFLLYSSQMLVSFATVKRPRGGAWLSLAIAGLALCVIGSLHWSWYMLFAVVAGASNGYINKPRQNIRAQNDQLVIAGQYGVGAVIALLALPLVGMGSPAVSWQLAVVGALGLLAYGVVTYALGFCLLHGYKVQRLSRSNGSVISVSQVVFATGFGLLFHQIPSALEIAGCVLIALASVGSALNSSWPTFVRRRAAQPQS